MWTAVMVHKEIFMHPA